MFDSVTPNLGTPPFNAPEDEFRNLHREDDENAISNDEIAR
jgi:hypothetical protein